MGTQKKENFSLPIYVSDVTSEAIEYASQRIEIMVFKLVEDLKAVKALLVETRNAHQIHTSEYFMVIHSFLIHYFIQ